MAIAFDNIAGGELAEKFRLALAQIGRDIMNPNMDPEAARGMTINLKFKPRKAGTIDIEFDIKTKLGGIQKSSTVFLIGQDAQNGRIEINEYNNNRPSYQAVQAVTAEQKRQAREEPKSFDPDTGEILEDIGDGRPIDLRKAASE